ncbi:MAG: hypothetical protein IPL35_08890 [Sphingobacteriales bacterium]|nr:hypothetical protein [Sphingobacteriales bacterium]
MSNTIYYYLFLMLCCWSNIIYAQNATSVSGKQQAMSAFESGRLSEAIAHFDAALLQNPNDYEAFYYRGLAHRYLKHTQQAFGDMSRSIALKPDYAPAYYYRAKLQPYLEPQKFIADISKAIQYDSDNADYVFERAMRKYRAVMDNYDNNDQNSIDVSKLSFAMDLCDDFKKAASLDTTLQEKADSYCASFQALMQQYQVSTDK